jgi:EAL domain-containing protein (putative c-di-GMP-specific phosphodiesterase class I)
MMELSIYDIGTGYSSHSYLQRLPINRVKIDEPFIREILTQASPVPIVRAIIAMAHCLNLYVLAEGLEREAQRRLLLNQGYDQAQGHFFGPPMSADEFVSLLPPVQLRKAG